MKILILGDIMGPSGMRAIKERLPELIKVKEVDFVIVNGENAADDGVGISKKNLDEILAAGADVITSGNHIWDQKETTEFIKSEKRLLRPENSLKPVPGEGYGIFKSRNNKNLYIKTRNHFFKIKFILKQNKKYKDLKKLKFIYL